jgi:hypothetical protein
MSDDLSKQNYMQGKMYAIAYGHGAVNLHRFFWNKWSQIKNLMNINVFPLIQYQHDFDGTAAASTVSIDDDDGMPFLFHKLIYDPIRVQNKSKEGVFKILHGDNDISGLNVHLLTLVHELQHLIQHERGDLQYDVYRSDATFAPVKEGFMNWKNEEYDMMKIQNDAEYAALPWEAEANTVARTVVSQIS